MALNEMEPGAGSSAAVRLGGTYDILPDRPLAELSAPGAVAYAAVNRERSADSLYALVCDPTVLPRHDVITALEGLHADAIVTPVAWGVVDWAPARRRSFAIVLDRPSGRRIVESLDQTIVPLSEDALLHAVLPPLVASLRGLFSLGRTHRAIRPSNLYHHPSATPQIVLGECVSGPPAAAQPLFCETIESGLALPAGRGAGSPGDDLYALGATILFLALGCNPVAELGDEQVLIEKINRGSYVALLGKARLPGALAEPVRGLLADDPAERWTLHDLDQWMQTRRLAPRQVSPPRRAARAFEFAGHGHVTARALAHGFARSPAAAIRTIRAPDFDAWMQRSLGDPERTAAVATALSEAQDLGIAGPQEDRLVARVCTALDPLAPIRCNGFAAAVDGFGPALAAAFHGHGSANAIAAAIAGRLPQFWFSAQAALRPEHAPLLRSFERLRLHLDDRRPGFGIERILYELNPGLHCLSPHVEADYVVDAADLLGALERAAASGRFEPVAVDRHLAAFIAARYRGASADWHDPLASGNAQERTLGVLLVLSRLQSWRGPAAVPALCERLARQLPPLIERFHNRPQRARLTAELAQQAAKGSLADLLAHVDGAAERRRDELGFLAAQREYQSIERALDLLRVGAPARPQHAAEVGGRLAVTASTFLAWAAAIAAVLLTSG